MRLIDATQVDFSAYIDPYEIPGAEECLANMPTVEAIPIEWLRKWEQKYNEQVDEPWFKGSTVISEVIKDWEKENDYS